MLRISSSFEGIGSFANSGNNGIGRWFNSHDDSDPAAESNGLFFGVFGKVCDKLSELARTDFPMDCRISSR